MITGDQFEEFLSFVMEHAPVLGHHKAFGDMVRSLRSNSQTGGLTTAMLDVLETRLKNSDVFAFPTHEQNLLYAIEELTEFHRAIQAKSSDHLRRANEHQDEELELGQVLMMVLTLAIQHGINPDVALQKALGTVDERCRNKRTAIVKVQ